ncbi:hypothetical protein C1645_827061 [Glomus cerebriforme]|uniref:Uncharacterized protein n=1 Tax=Glomus cerebriforme TaxID=658196 RepID=A0A397SQH0_9GLOM|nr:hypothetical protein C1645_827061 [Glomus cerebriforme]
MEDSIVSKFQQSELNPIIMENAYHNPEESEKEADKGEENKDFAYIFKRLYKCNVLSAETRQKKTKSGYERLLKTVIKKVVLKYNDGNENGDYLKNKNYRSTSFQKSVSADDKELDESDESDESDE